MQSDPDSLAYFVPSVINGRLFHDLMGRLVARQHGEQRLEIRGPVPAGLYDLFFVTAPGAFPVNSIMIQATEWPSRKTVAAGPFDLDHTTYQMAVPTFRVFVNDDYQGLAWCQVPSPADMAAQRVRGHWGIRVPPTDGEVRIVLEIPETETRLNWSAVEILSLGADERYSLPLGKFTPPPAPRVLAAGATFDRLAASRDTIQQAMLDRLLVSLEEGDDGSYVYRTVTAAVVGRLTGDDRWLDEAVARAMALCDREHWGYHNIPGIMGWNNDRDTGVRMYEAAVVYDLCADRLTPEQRQRLRDKLAYHARLAYQVTTLQKDYWYRRCAEAHGQGFWYGFAAAAVALLDDEPEAREWLEWIHGNLVDALHYLPEDGISEWLVFNVQWHILAAELFERLLGRKLRGGPFPFLKNFGRRIAGYVAEEPARRPVLGTLLFYLASRHRDPRMQADAFRACGLTPAGRWQKDQRLDPLTPFVYNPDIEVGKPSPRPLAVNSQSGHVICRGRHSDTEFVFRCGTPLTPRKHGGHHWMNRAWYHAQHAGSYSWTVGGTSVVPVNIPGYRQRSAEANLLTVDGGGNPTDGRWLGYDIDLWNLPFIEQFAGDDSVTYCCGNLSHAYSQAAGVRHCSRRWVYFHDLDVLVMLDRVTVDKPRDLAWHVHANRGRWQPEDDFRFHTAAGGVDFRVEALYTRIDGFIPESMPAAMDARVRRPQFVPPYTTGVNTYKTLDWQPEVHGSQPDIPPYWDLQFAPMGTCRDWELMTVMGPGALPPLTWRLAGGATIAVIGEAGAVKWRRDGGVPITLLNVNVTADLVVRIGSRQAPQRWLGFGVTRWIQDGVRTVLDEPANLVWTPGQEAPKPLPG